LVAILVGIGLGVLFAAAFTKATIGILGIILFSVATFFAWVAWAMFRLSRSSSRQGAAGWPPPPPPAGHPTPTGPSGDWLRGAPLTASPTSGMRAWWIRNRGRFRQGGGPESGPSSTPPSAGSQAPPTSSARPASSAAWPPPAIQAHEDRSNAG